MNMMPRSVGQLLNKTASLEAERENFEKAQHLSISKATSQQECAPKEKHVRVAIIGTFQEKSSTTFWFESQRLPLQNHPLTCWKFCYLLHKVLREGHESVRNEALAHKGFLNDLGRLWGHLRMGYGPLTSKYITFILTRINFHARNSFPNNLEMSNAQLHKLIAGDVNTYFQLCVEMMDYLEDILNLVETVNATFDSSTSISVSSSGQCRCAPLIPCILDSCKLYDYIVKIMFTLHGSLPEDLLMGHQNRFKDLFNRLSKFYEIARKLQALRGLIDMPSLPERVPDFQEYSNLELHVTPVATVIEQRDDVSTIDGCSDGLLIDTTFDESRSVASELDFPNTRNLLSQEKQEQAASYDASSDMVAQYADENDKLRGQIERIKADDHLLIEDLRNQVFELDAELAAVKNLFQISQDKNAQLERMKNSPDMDQSFKEAKDKAASFEEKFKKMKQVYMDLRNEHVNLLRKNAEVSRKVSCAEKELEQEKIENERSKLVLEQLTHDKSRMEEQLQNTEHSTAKQLEEVQSDKQELLTKAQQLENDVNELNLLKAKLNVEIKRLAAQTQEAEESLRNKEIQFAAREEQFHERSKNRVIQLLIATVEESLKILQASESRFDETTLLHYSCPPDYLMQSVENARAKNEQIRECLAGITLPSIKSQTLSSAEEDKIQQLIKQLCSWAHSIGDVIEKGRTTANVIDDFDLVDLCKSLFEDAVKLLDHLKCLNEELCEQQICVMDSLLQSLIDISSAMIRTTASASQDLDKLPEILEEEMQQMDAAIESATARISQILQKTKMSGVSGVKLQVNETIADSCGSLVAAVKMLVRASRAMQKEIASKGCSKSGNVKEFYVKNNRWTEGMISGAKTVGKAAMFLVDTADKLISSEGKFEQLIVASQNISVSTVQLVVASRVKADKNSETFRQLSLASKNVAEATAKVVASTRACAEMLEESRDLDFSDMSLLKIKRMEMDSQVHVLELENELMKERDQLSKLRKMHYAMAGAAEGWDEEDTR